MNHRVVDVLIWVLIYGGIFLAILGWFMRGGNPVLAGLGGLCAAVGVVLIVVRSRMKDEP
jgi:hypothetical protein